MDRTRTIWCVLAIACGQGRDASPPATGGAAPNGTSTSGTTPSGPDDDAPPSGSSGSDQDPGPGDPPKFDVGDNACLDAGPGIHCEEHTAIECGDAGEVIDVVDCSPQFCAQDRGCVPCLDGQLDCQGPAVVQCNAAADPRVWEPIEICDPAAGMGCDLALGTCVPLEPVGGIEPTGEYYQYAFFDRYDGSDVFEGGYDVDSLDDRIWVTNYDGGVDVYRVELLDSDGDGQLEPNQHPDNPDHPGAIEERRLTFVETIDYTLPFLGSQSELFVAADRFFMGGTEITEYILANGATTAITTAPDWIGIAPQSRLSQLGYDDVHGVWYASHGEDYRRVLQHDAATDTWGIAFYYPDLAGTHMDGLEVVTDPNTGVPYVYVSDMTSDFIGQYRKDPEVGWVQTNVFTYAGETGEAVEGMGFGALHHFWATSGSALYELGGGELAQYTDPAG